MSYPLRRYQRSKSIKKSQVARHARILKCGCETRNSDEARGETCLRGKPSLVYRTGEKPKAYIETCLMSVSGHKGNAMPSACHSGIHRCCAAPTCRSSNASESTLLSVLNIRLYASLCTSSAALVLDDHCVVSRAVAQMLVWLM